MKREKNEIVNVVSESIAKEAGIEIGDVLLSINDEEVIDIFDYNFLTSNEELVLKIRKKNGEEWEIEVEKDENEDLGIEFHDSLIEGAKSCCNKCIFCFIDQLPKGMRKTLYFKDDDSRLSFLMGNYITLTNITYDDIRRIIKYRMSPINVSVHTTDPELRKNMLKNKSAGDVMDKIKMLVEAGINVNCQIVLCRNVNDGVNLQKTIEDLVLLHPRMNSISVVPVGITKYREGLFELEPFDVEAANEVINQVEQKQHELLGRIGSRVVYLADEFYLLSKRDVPEYNSYEDFPQIENGVGLIASLQYEFNEALKMVEDNKFEVKEHKVISIATGVAAYKTISNMAQILNKKYNIKILVYEIINSFFGENVTVTGLLTGKDVYAQLKGKELGDKLLLCKSMLKSDEDIFLDDFKLKELAEKLSVNIDIVSNSGYDFVGKILNVEIVEEE